MVWWVRKWVRRGLEEEQDIIWKRGREGSVKGRGKAVNLNSTSLPLMIHFQCPKNNQPLRYEHLGMNDRLLTRGEGYYVPGTTGNITHLQKIKTAFRHAKLQKHISAQRFHHNCPATGIKVRLVKVCWYGQHNSKLSFPIINQQFLS